MSNIKASFPVDWDMVRELAHKDFAEVPEEWTPRKKNQHLMKLLRSVAVISQKQVAEALGFPRRGMYVYRESEDSSHPLWFLRMLAAMYGIPLEDFLQEFSVIIKRRQPR